MYLKVTFKRPPNILLARSVISLVAQLSIAVSGIIAIKLIINIVILLT